MVVLQRPRPPSQYISQQEWEIGVQDEDDFILGRRYDVLAKFHAQEYQQDHGFVKELQGRGRGAMYQTVMYRYTSLPTDLTLEYVQKNGMSQPMVFRSPEGLGMK